MSRLTSQLLDNFPYTEYADPQSIQRGRDYYKRGNVWNVELVNDRQAICFIGGDSGEYEVSIKIDIKGDLLFECDCPYADYVHQTLARARGEGQWYCVPAEAATLC